MLDKEEKIFVDLKIHKNFIISGQEQVEMFADAIEASANDRTPRVHVNMRELTDRDEIRALMPRRKTYNLSAYLIA